MLGFDFVKTLFLVGNFFVLLFVLKKIFYKPIMEILEDRKEKIKEGLEQRAIAKQEREEIIKKREEVIAQTKLDAQKIIKQANEMKEKIIAKAKEETKVLLQKAKEIIAKEREELKEEMNLKLVDLVSHVAYAALPDLAKQEGHKDLVENAILHNLKQASSM